MSQETPIYPSFYQRARATQYAGVAALLMVCSASLANIAAAMPIAVANPVVLTDPADGRQIPLRIAYPTAGRRLPVVLFSHGAYSSKDDYNALLDAWAAGGYIVLAVTHRDSLKLGGRRGTGDPRHFGWRLDDMTVLLTRLPEALAQVPGLSARADITRIAATGHSFGGLVAQTLGGATYFDAASQVTVGRRDPRVRAVIVFSGAGAFPPTLRPEDFLALRIPTLVTVGSNDLKQAPDLSGYEWRKQPFDLAPAGHKFLLTLNGADHYLGGSVGRDDLPQDPNGPAFVAAFNAISLQFLNAWLRDDQRARRRLEQNAARSAGKQPLQGMPLALLQAK